MVSKIDSYMNYLTFGSLLALCAFTFTSFSLTALSHILIIAPGIFYFIKAIKAKKDIFSYSSLSLLLLVVVALLSVFVNWSELINPVGKVAKVKYLLIGFLSIFAYREIWKSGFLTEKRIRLLVNLFIVSIIIASVSGGLAAFTGFHYLRMKPASHGNANCGMYGMCISFGYGVQYAVLIFLGLWINRNRLAPYYNKYLLYAGTILSFLALYQNYSRGALFSCIVALPFLFYKKMKRTFIIVGICSFVVLSIVATITVYISGEDKGDVFHSRYFYNMYGRSNLMRALQYKTSYKMFKENPLLGVGFRGFEENSLKTQKKYNLYYKLNLQGIERQFKGHAHNNFLEFLTGMGILGFILLLLFHIFWFYELNIWNTYAATLGIPVIVAFFVSGLVQSTIIDGENMFLVMMVYAITQISRKPILKGT